MQKLTRRVIITSLLPLLGGCYSVDCAWEDAKTASRFIQQKSRSILGNHSESRQVASRYEFYANHEEEFVPLQDQAVSSQYVDYAIPQSSESPGDPSGKIPGITAFSAPNSVLASIFKKILFNTDEHVPKSPEQFQSVRKIADYLRKHPDVYVFIEGHADERASEAYNLALATRRCNFVRKMLAKEGINSERLFTVSYGKERPIDLGHSKEAWAKNRRVEFKIYERGITL